MWIRTSSVLLAIFAVSGLSLPHPDDSQYQIPDVGTGDRSQFYVLHSDGTFKYGFDTGDGAFEAAKSHSVGNREGKFGYVDPDGKTIRLEYEAGLGGFVARGDHLPKPSPELARAIADVVASSKPFVDPLASGDSDASYGFGFQSDDHSRNEKSDSDGTVTGSYSYVDENGVTRSFTYRAGKGIGFEIEGDGLTQDVSAPSTSSRQGSSQTFRSHQPTSLYQAPRSQPSATRRTQTPTRHFTGTSSLSTTGSYTGPEANVAFTRSQTPGDASYSFSYDAGDHSRSESSGSDLNVDGTFSFVADDGNRRTVDYVAGSSTGFQATGDHLPRAPAVDTRGQPIAPRGYKSGTTRHNGFGSQTRQHGHASGGGFSVPSSVSSYIPPTVTSTASQTRSSASRRPSSVSSFHRAQTGSFEEADIRSSFSPLGPYSFSYDTSSHSRSESGDADNNVVGKFDFVADDDDERYQISYEAGSATGFIAEGAHIPVGPEVPGAPSGQPTGRIVRVSSVPFVDPLAKTNTDASYDFEFESDTYSRQESSDRDGNVVGSYTVVDDDGTRRTYNFKAGEGIGFEAEEVSRSQGPVPSRSATHTTSSQGAVRASTSHGSAVPTTSYLPPRPSSQTSVAQISRSHAGSRAATRPSFQSHSTRSQTKHSGVSGLPSLPPTLFRTSPTSHRDSDFTLNKYEASPDSEKFGYVLRFN